MRPLVSSRAMRSRNSRFSWSSRPARSGPAICASSRRRDVRARPGSRGSSALSSRSGLRIHLACFHHPVGQTDGQCVTGVQPFVEGEPAGRAGAADAFRHQRRPAAIRRKAHAGHNRAGMKSGRVHQDHVGGQHQPHRSAGHGTVDRGDDRAGHGAQAQDHPVQRADHALRIGQQGLAVVRAGPEYPRHRRRRKRPVRRPSARQRGCPRPYPARPDTLRAGPG